MQRRELKELDLLDDFLWGSVMSHPEYGEEFSRILLKIIFGKDVGKLKVVPQKVLYGTNTDLRGARLDVYLEEAEELEISESTGLVEATNGKSVTEDEEAENGAEIDRLVVSDTGTIYDIEPDKNDKKKDREALPKRVRFYHAKIDGASLKSGETFENLKRVVVIFVTPYDPFDRKRMRYTIANMCREVPEMPYDDGAATIFLYTKGTEGNPSKELKQLLRYLEHTTWENAVNKELQHLQNMVENVKRDGEVSLEYMKAFERIQRAYDEGREEEMKNTERERKRAETAEQKVEAAEQKAEATEKELQRLRERLRKYEGEN